MTSMIGGTDLIFETARQGFQILPVLDAMLDVWPDGFFQTPEEENARPLSAVLAGDDLGDLREFFVYKDKASAESWIENGWTEEHANDMAHFLIAEDTARVETIQITLVIGSVSGETIQLVAAVFDVLRRMSAGESGPADRSRRINWDADLQAVGYMFGRESFYEKVEELRNALFPDWTIDQLACHPHEALQFCEVVRRSVGPVPDHFVMMALMDRRRKRKNATASIGTRLFLGRELDFKTSSGG